jgi:hypothetical protein
MHDVEGFPDVFGGSIPAMIWHDFMVAALAHTPWMSFPQPSFVGYDVYPPQSFHYVAPTPTPTPSPSPSPKKKHHHH